MPGRSRLAATALGAGAVAIPSAIFATTYVVRPGDSLLDIATRHATTVAALEGANGVSAASLRPGRLLSIPDQRAALPGYTRSGDDTEQHAVAAGEGVLQVARRYGVDATALARLNGINVNAQLGTGATLAVPGRLARMRSLIDGAAEATGSGARLVRAVAWAESGWDQRVASPTGAIGVMQLEPAAGDWVSQQLAGRHLDLRDARDNVAAGALLLRHLLAAHAGDVDGALAAYYQGDASVARHGRYEDTERYVSTVGVLMRDDDAAA